MNLIAYRNKVTLLSRSTADGWAAIRDLGFHYMRDHSRKLEPMVFNNACLFASSFTEETVDERRVGAMLELEAGIVFIVWQTVNALVAMVGVKAVLIVEAIVLAVAVGFAVLIAIVVLILAVVEALGIVVCVTLVLVAGFIICVVAVIGSEIIKELGLLEVVIVSVVGWVIIV